jgi:hypothetical protein
VLGGISERSSFIDAMFYAAKGGGRGIGKAKSGVEMISPNRENRLEKNRMQDGRKLHRNRGRWIVERFFAKLGWQRRPFTRSVYTGGKLF